MKKKAATKASDARGQASSDSTGANPGPNERDLAAVEPKESPGKRKSRALPPEIRADLEHRLVAGSFSDYRALARWLSGHGYQIGRSAICRSSKTLERRLGTLKLATEQARAVVGAAGAADDTVNEGLMRLVQGDLFRVLIELKELNPKKVNLNALARNVASICRSSVQMRRVAEEMRTGIGRRVLAAELKVVAAARRGARGGLSAAAERRIRAALLEIAEMPAPEGDEPAPAVAQPLAGSVPVCEETARPEDEASETVGAIETADARSDG